MVQAWWGRWELAGHSNGGKRITHPGSQPRKSCRPGREVRSPSEGLGSVHHVLQPLQRSGVACLLPYCPQNSFSPAGAPQKHESLGPTAALRELEVWGDALHLELKNGLRSLGPRSGKVTLMMVLLLPSTWDRIGFPNEPQRPAAYNLRERTPFLRKIKLNMRVMLWE